MYYLSLWNTLLMKISSAKAKGRRLQQWVVEQVLANTNLKDTDVRSTAMGQSGLDVQLSEAARKLFPFAVECKSQERFKGLYEVYSQSETNKEGMTPIVVIKSNRQIPLVVISADDFFKIVFKKKEK